MVLVVFGTFGPRWIRVRRDNSNDPIGIQTITGQMMFDSADIATVVELGFDVWENLIKREVSLLIISLSMWYFHVAYIR